MLEGHYEIYTDGGFDEKGAVGSWAYLILCMGEVIPENSGRVLNTDSNRMELQAAIEALNHLPQGSTAVLYSDSRVMIDGITKEILIWKEFGWKKRNGGHVRHLDLFVQLDEVASRHLITWKWVKSHNGNAFNERCDQLCLLARRVQQTKSQLVGG